MSTVHDTPVQLDDRPSGRHPVNVGHLVMGIAFLGLVGIWSLVQSEVVGRGDVRWLLPLPWVLAGLAGLLAIGLSSSRRWSGSGPHHQVGWVAPPASGPTTDPIDATDPIDSTDTPEETR